MNLQKNQDLTIQARAEAITAEIQTDNLTVAEAEWETAREAARSALESYNTANAQELRYRNQLQAAIDARNRTNSGNCPSNHLQSATQPLTMCGENPAGGP
jgi:hypothetical protein